MCVLLLSIYSCRYCYICKAPVLMWIKWHVRYCTYKICSGGENVSHIPGAYATHNFAYLLRGPLRSAKPSQNLGNGKWLHQWYHMGCIHSLTPSRKDKCWHRGELELAPEGEIWGNCCELFGNKSPYRFETPPAYLNLSSGYVMYVYVRDLRQLLLLFGGSGRGCGGGVWGWVRAVSFSFSSILSENERAT